MITLEDFNKVAKGAIFATGVNTVPEFDKAAVCWVAVKGAADDWALYYGRSAWTPYMVKTDGIKASTLPVIQRLVNCDDDVMTRYRQ